VDQSKWLKLGLDDIPITLDFVGQVSSKNSNGFPQAVASNEGG